MEEYVIYIFLIVGLFFVGSLGFTIIGLCYSYMKLKIVELKILKDKIL